MLSTLPQTVPQTVSLNELRTSWIAQTTAMLARFTPIADAAVPSIEELHMLYSFYGEVKPHKLRRCVFGVEMIGKSVVFQSRAAAWDYYLQNKDWLATLALIKPCPF